jgi:hypothetical protein
MLLLYVATQQNQRFKVYYRELGGFKYIIMSSENRQTKHIITIYNIYNVFF